MPVGASSHKHSYNANSGVGCTQQSHTCFKNWTGTSCGMESDIITEGFQRSEEMHQLRFTQLVGDGDSSVFYSVALNVEDE